MTININELRRLAQAATPGPWVAKNVSGAGLEIHMIHPLYPDKEWPAFGTDSAFCKKGLVSYETWTQFPHEVQNVQQSKNAEYIAAANPAVINELLDRLEAAEKSDAESIAMYRKARDERAALRAENAALVDDMNLLRNNNTALRAKVAEMEKQEPLDAGSDVFRSAFEAALKAGNWPATRQGDGYRSPSTQIAWRIAFSTVNRLKLYALPGAQGEEK